MANCYIYFSCVQQELKRTDKNKVAAEAANTVAARFELDSKWQGLNVYARFKHMSAVYDVQLENNEAVIPVEVLKPTGFSVSIFGEDESGARLTSARVFVEVEETISYDGAQPIPSTPSLLRRFENMVNACLEISNSIKQDAEDGKFNGTPFRIVKQYSSVLEMEEDETGYVKEGEFVIITSNVEDPDNAKLYLRNSSGWSFITDMSGAQGVGIKGDTGTLEVGTVETGEAGSSASVTNVGTPDSAILNFVIPKGDKGDKGDTGDIGNLKASEPITYADNTVGILEAATVPTASGTAGQVLVKTESGREWQDAPESLPEGGTAGQVLTRTASGAEWRDTVSDWDSLSGKPDTFTPTAHEHGAGDITSGILPIERGGTGAGSASEARANIDVYSKAEVDEKTAGGAVPLRAGIIYLNPGTTLPDGFLWCRGQAVSRTEYSELFAVIGTTYGGGDGSNTFNVPDLGGRVPVGSVSELAHGSMGGEETHVLTVDEMPKHRHEVKNLLNTNAGSTKVQNGNYYTFTQGDVYTEYAGGGLAHNNMQPYTVLGYIISTGKGSVVSVSDIVQGATALPLGVEYGGTGNANSFKLLWSGSVSSGSISIPGVENYNLLAIRTANGTGISFKKNNEHVFSIATTNNAGNAYLDWIVLTVGTDKLTFKANYDTVHTISENWVKLESTQKSAITDIYGIA